MQNTLQGFPVQQISGPNEFLFNLALLLFIIVCFAVLALVIFLILFVKEMKERIITTLSIAEENAVRAHQAPYQHRQQQHR